MNTNKIAQKLAELKFGKSIEMGSRNGNDKVGFSDAEAMQLEGALETILDHFKSKEAYSKSNTMKVIDKHSDQVQPKRIQSEILVSANDMAKQILKLINKK